MQKLHLASSEVQIVLPIASLQQLDSETERSKGNNECHKTDHLIVSLFIIDCQTQRKKPR